MACLPAFLIDKVLAVGRGTFFIFPNNFPKFINSFFFCFIFGQEDRGWENSPVDGSNSILSCMKNATKFFS